MRVLSFFTRKIITPHKIIVNNGKAIFDISILLYISYQLFISLDYIINEHNRTMPLLYDGVISESDNLVERENLMAEIKQFDFLSLDELMWRETKKLMTQTIFFTHLFMPVI